VRYEETQAYKDHTKPAAANRGKVLLEGAERFIVETEQLAKNKEVRRTLKTFNERLKKEEQANRGFRTLNRWFRTLIRRPLFLLTKKISK